MLRKALFGGLTVMLAAVLIWLIVRGRQQETRLAAAPGEVVKTARSSSTRVIVPKDLEVSITRAPDGSGQTSRSLGKVSILNTSSRTYHNVMLRLSFAGSDGKVLGSRNHLVTDSIGPEQTFVAGEISLDGAPGGTTRCEATILYSELRPPDLGGR